MAYTTIDDPSAHFYTYAFSKSSGTGSVTFDANSDLQPDFLWVKSRTNADSHELWDSTRGVNSTLFSDNADAEDTAANRIVSFDTDGFTWGNAGNLNAAGSFVSWAWKANGGTTSSNTDGDITSTVQANTDAGFSIAEYTGNGLQDQTIGHGLGAVPKMVLYKCTSESQYWYVYHIGTGNDTMMYLNLSNGAQSLPSQFSTPTTSTFNVSNENSTFGGYNSSGRTYIAYVFAEKQGFSKFGKYIGNGNANGTFVYTGFKPAFLMFKQTSAANNWVMIDSARDTYNAADATVYADLANAEENPASSVTGVDLLSNGFKFRDSKSFWNTSGGTYIYMAFAENPFVTSTGIPTTAR